VKLGHPQVAIEALTQVAGIEIEIEEATEVTTEGEATVTEATALAVVWAVELEEAIASEDKDASRKTLQMPKLYLGIRYICLVSCTV
jgi:hypothetical protein